MTNDALARWEGGFNLTGTPFDGSAIKTWGTQGNSHSCNGGPHSCQPPPTHAWESQGNPTKDYQYILPTKDYQYILVEETKGAFQPGVVGSMTSTFMQYIVMYALGRANELGFASSRLQTYSGKWLVDMVNISGQPKLIATYRLPIEKKVTATSPGGYFTWNEIVTQAYTPTFMTKLSNFYTGPTIADSYGPLTRMAAAYLIDNSVPGATQAWSWLKTNVYDKVSDYSRNPQWSFVMRTDTNVLPAISTYMPPFPVK